MVDENDTISINIRLKGRPKDLFESVMNKFMFESYAEGFRFILSQYIELSEKNEKIIDNIKELNQNNERLITLIERLEITAKKE